MLTVASRDSLWRGDEIVPEEIPGNGLFIDVEG